MTEKRGQKTKNTKPQSSKADTIDRILTSARQEFSSSGLAGARMDDIARSAGVTKQLLYHYYENKDDLFASVLNRQTEKIVSELMALELDNLRPKEALRRFLNFANDQYQRDPELIFLAQEAITFHKKHNTKETKFPDMIPPVVEKLDALLKRGISSGDFKKNINPHYFLAMALFITTGRFTHSYMLSSLLGFDTNSPEGSALWHEYAMNFVLSAVSTD